MKICIIKTGNMNCYFYFILILNLVLNNPVNCDRGAPVLEVPASMLENALDSTANPEDTEHSKPATIEKKTEAKYYKIRTEVYNQEKINKALNGAVDAITQSNVRMNITENVTQHNDQIMIRNHDHLKHRINKRQIKENLHPEVLPEILEVQVGTLASSFKNEDRSKYQSTNADSYQGYQHDGREHTPGFSGKWTVMIEGGEKVAELVAMTAGYVYIGKAMGFDDVYVFGRDDHAVTRRGPSQHHTSTLTLHKDVKWADQLFDKQRTKRSIPYDLLGYIDNVETKGREDGVLNSKEASLSSSVADKTDETKNRKRSNRKLESNDGIFNDELWNKQWYLQDTRSRSSLPRLDLGVVAVYRRGVSGRGVTVSVLDDGLDHQHTDLAPNYAPEISWDCNDRDPDPSPRYDPAHSNSHGTRCAGEIAMVANNSKCGVGVAWGARVGGVRMLDGTVNDLIEGEALGYAWDKVDIYSASWGPSDDGRTVEGPGRLAQAAIERGIAQGRGGKGSIYVWANGNGGSKHDDCNCDGYSSSIYTVSVGSASQHGMFPWYGETCASTLATAYSSGAYRDQKIVTTDLYDRCTLHHSGTSAAAPLAAGIIALALEANPALTWRDVQHLVVWSSGYSSLIDTSGTIHNGAGLQFDPRFGFGLLNADALVNLALDWTTVPPKNICTIGSYQQYSEVLMSGSEVDLMFHARRCQLHVLEHVELVLNVEYSRRGAISVTLISPSGTKALVLGPRPLDDSTSGFANWRLSSVATWGEDPSGTWHAIVADKHNESNIGTVGICTLVLHGTEEIPHHMKKEPQVYESADDEDSDDFYKGDDIVYVTGPNPFAKGDLYTFTENIITFNQNEDPQKALQVTEMSTEANDTLEKVLLRVHHEMNPFYKGNK